MGLFGGLFGNFEKLERQGDDAFSNHEPLKALNAFRDALKKAKKDPLATSRLQSKLVRAQDGFVRAKLTEAEEWVAEDMPDYATEALLIARDNITPQNPALKSQIERLEEEVRKLLSADTNATSLGDFARPEGATAPVGVDIAGGLVAPEDELAAISATDERLFAEFEQLLGALPEPDQDLAEQLGYDFKVGYVAHHNEERQAAIAALKKTVSQFPDSPLALELLGVELDLAGEPNEAGGYFDKALTLDPKRMNSRLALASFIAKLPPSPGVQMFKQWTMIAAGSQERPKPEAAKGDLARALQLLEDGMKHNPEAKEIYLLTATEFSLANNEPAQALSFIEQVLEIAESASPTHQHLLSVAHELNGGLDEAETAYEMAAKLGRNALFFRAEFAEFALRHNRSLEEAEELISKVCIGCQAQIPQQEELDYYGFLLTRILHARGEFADALESIDRILETNPPDLLEKELLRMQAEINNQS